MVNFNTVLLVFLVVFLEVYRLTYPLAYVLVGLWVIYKVFNRSKGGEK